MFFCFFWLDEVPRKSMVFLLEWPAAFMYGTPRVSHKGAPALVYTAFSPKPRLSALAKRLVYTAFPPKPRLFTTPGSNLGPGWGTGLATLRVSRAKGGILGKPDPSFPPPEDR